MTDLDYAEEYLRNALKLIETARSLSSIHGDPDQTWHDFEEALDSAKGSFGHYFFPFWRQQK
jgi:hypothetical protein